MLCFGMVSSYIDRLPYSLVVTTICSSWTMPRKFCLSAIITMVLVVGRFFNLLTNSMETAFKIGSNVTDEHNQEHRLLYKLAMMNKETL